MSPMHDFATSLRDYDYMVVFVNYLHVLSDMNAIRADEELDNHHMSIDAPFGSDDDDNAMVVFISAMHIVPLWQILLLDIKKIVDMMFIF